jgi:hypothetical protein
MRTLVAFLPIAEGYRVLAVLCCIFQKNFPSQPLDSSRCNSSCTILIHVGYATTEEVQDVNPNEMICKGCLWSQSSGMWLTPIFYLGVTV